MNIKIIIDWNKNLSFGEDNKFKSEINPIKNIRKKHKLNNLNWLKKIQNNPTSKNKPPESGIDSLPKNFWWLSPE